MRVLRPGMLIAAGVVLLAACQENRAVVTEPVGPPSYDSRTWVVEGLRPAGTVGTVGTDTIVFTIRNLAQLQSGGYAFWAAEVAGGYTKLTGNILEFFLRDSTVGGVPVIDPVTEEVIQVPDTNVVSGVDSYAGPTDDDVTSVSARMAAPGAASQNSAVVSLNGDGDGQFMWRRIGAEGNGSLFYGNFGGAADEGTLVTDTIDSPADADFVYSVISSRLVGGYRGDEVVVELQGIGRPPEGFVYNGYLVDDDGDVTFVGALTSPAPERADYSDADTDDAKVTIGFDPRKDQAIPWGQVRNCVTNSGVASGCDLDIAASTDSVSAFAGFAAFAVSLDPKSGVAGTRNVIWSAAVPEIVRSGAGEYR